MAKVRFKKITSPPREQPAYLDEGAMEARRLQRSGIKDVIWVAVGLFLILVVGMIYEATQGPAKRTARLRAEAAARSAQATPYTSYQTPTRYPTAEEIQADAMVREARDLAAANAAANAADPALNHQLAQPTAPAYSPVPPSPFGNAGPAPAGAVAPGAAGAVAPAAAPPMTPPAGSPQ